MNRYFEKYIYKKKKKKKGTIRYELFNILSMIIIYIVLIYI